MADTPRLYTTNEAAHVLRCAENTLRWNLARKGSYWNVIPAKQPNGRLLWPADQIDALATTGTSEQQEAA